MKKFILCKLCLVILIVLAAAKPAQAGKISWQIDTNNNARLSGITKNPAEMSFDGLTVYQFEIEHGACGGDQYWSDCESDRQRVELKDGYKVSLQSFGSNPKKIKKFYRTNLLLPAESEFPNTLPMTQMIHQVKLHQKNNPIWMVHHHEERLRITADNGEKCFVDQKYIPRNRWLEIEIHADYTVDGKVDDTEPSFSYLIDGQIVCQLLSPLVTTRALRDGNRKQLQLKFGIYNTFPSKWLLSQPENQQWVRANKIEFSGYQQDSKGESNGAVRSAMASPFDYDWPVKLPVQVLYYTDWFVGNSRDELGPSRFRLRKSAEVEISESPPDLTVDFSVTTREVCVRALPEWKRGGGAWSKHAEARGLSVEGCELFKKLKR
ncbi:MAG: hypothetical protein CMD87_00355 [Gammaproteobacteria bacterium]|nr:hypothetical protein [Gammaproteobacteria bacterium]